MAFPPVALYQQLICSEYVVNCLVSSKVPKELHILALLIFITVLEDRSIWCVVNEHLLYDKACKDVATNNKDMDPAHR